MSIPYRPLGHISVVLEKMGLEVTFAYDDIVYVSHSAFILQMGEKGEDVLLYFNVESEENDRGEVLSQLEDAANDSGVHFIESGTFEMSQKDDDNVELKFFS